MKEFNRFKRYLELRYSPSTVKQYMGCCKAWAGFLDSQEAIDKFIIEVINKRGSNPLYFGFLKALIDCYKLPFKVPKSKRKRSKGHTKLKYLTKQQIDHIIRYASPKIALLVKLYFETGLRLRELLNVHWNDIDLQNRTLSGIGKGNKPFCEKFSKKTAILLQKYLNFPGNEREYPFQKDADIDQGKAFWYKLKKECSELGIEGVHPHMIRHGLGKYLKKEKGLDLNRIRIKLRHSKLETTSIYANESKEEVDQIIDKEVFEE